MIPYGHQDVTAEDIRAVVEVLQSDFLTQGPVVPRFEKAVAARVGAPHGVAANSATSSLHLACLALDVGPGDRVWTVPNTFVASANCARYCGADVEFVDITRDTHNLDVERLDEALRRARAAGTLPKVVIPVHFAGQPVEMPAVARLAQAYGFQVIEDAAHAIGASSHGVPVGDCRWSSITVFSFHPVKIITTAEGGLATTKDARLAARMRHLRSHGITREPGALSMPYRGAWQYEQTELGFNYRMTEMQAALGLSQLGRIDEYVARRNELADRYDELLRQLPLTLPVRRPGVVSAFHLYVVRVQPVAARTRDAVFTRLREAGIGVNVHYAPVHLQPYYRARGGAPGQCPEAERYAEEALTLPLYPTLTSADQDRVVDAVREAVCG